MEFSSEFEIIVEELVVVAVGGFPKAFLGGAGKEVPLRGENARGYRHLSPRLVGKTIWTLVRLLSSSHLEDPFLNRARLHRCRQTV